MSVALGITALVVSVIALGSSMYRSPGTEQSWRRTDGLVPRQTTFATFEA